jgi:hypothetical protein
MGPNRPPTISFGAPGGADRSPPGGARRGQPQDANAGGGATHHEHGKSRGVHGALVRIPGFFCKHKGVALVLRQRSQSFSIHKTYVRPRSAKGHLEEGGRWQEEQDPEAKKRNPCQKEENPPWHPWLLSPVQSPYPFCEYPAHSCQVLFPHVTSASYSPTEPDANFLRTPSTRSSQNDPFTHSGELPLGT